MTFVGSGFSLLMILIFFSTSISNIFIGLDNVQFLDSSFSVLDIYISIILLELVFWFINRIVGAVNEKYEKDYYEKSTNQYQAHGEYQGGETIEMNTENRDSTMDD